MISLFYNSMLASKIMKNLISLQINFMLKVETFTTSDRVLFMSTRVTLKKIKKIL